jgi:hypothetical protein
MNLKLPGWLRKDITPPRARAAPSSFFRLLGRVGGFLILLVLCLFSWWRTLLTHDVNSQFARIRAVGLPVSGAELNVWRRPVPDTENGALVLNQAFALLRTFPDRRSNEVVELKMLNRTNDWPTAARGLVEAYVQTNAPALAKAREALLLPRFRYPVDFAFGPETLMPHLALLKEMARIVALANALDAKEGHAENWPENVAFELKLAGTLDDEPTVISYLIHDSIIVMAARATERSLNLVSPSDDACQRLQAAFSHAGDTNLLPLALVGERALMIPIFRLSRKEIQSFSQEDARASRPQRPQRYSGEPAFFVWLTGFFERDLDFYLHTMEKCISLAALPPPGSLTLTNYLQSRSDVAQKRLYITSSMLLPALSRLIMHEATSQALIKLATTALAVERFRFARGRLPDDLRDLTPQFLDVIPTDPFDGASLRYRRLARGYVIYSVDADGHDDGGREPPERKKTTDQATYDLTFIVAH